MTKLLLIASGSIGVLHLSSYVAAAKQEGWDVRCVMTAATRIVPPSTVAAFCPVYAEDNAGELRVAHIELAGWASAVAVIPATANMLAKIAAGIGDNLATTTLLAVRIAVAVFPNMESTMWTNPIVQRNVESIRSFGYQVWSKPRTMYSVGRGAYEEGIGIPIPMQFIEFMAELNQEDKAKPEDR